MVAWMTRDESPEPIIAVVNAGVTPNIVQLGCLGGVGGWLLRLGASRCDARV